MQQSSVGEKKADDKDRHEPAPLESDEPRDVEKSYYYDDAHGYEDFNPDEAGEDDKERDK